MSDRKFIADPMKGDVAGQCLNCRRRDKPAVVCEDCLNEYTAKSDAELRELRRLKVVADEFMAQCKKHPNIAFTFDIIEPLFEMKKILDQLNDRDERER